MASVNKVILLGNLGRDPELKTVGDNSITSLAVATSRRVKGKDGNYSNETEWHNVTLFGRNAETVAKHFAKGDSIYIEGRIHTREYTDKQGIKRWRTDIICDNWQFGSKRNGNGGTEGNDGEDIAF